MTNTDDWTRFQNMMVDTGWRMMPVLSAEITFWMLDADYLFSSVGTLSAWDRKYAKWNNVEIGDWRTWLEAGSTPAPF